MIERMNKEFKRRIKPMEIVAGEAASYRLLAFISLKMELHWRTNPVEKVRANLPFYKNFTQISSSCTHWVSNHAKFICKNQNLTLQTV